MDKRYELEVSETSNLVSRGDRKAPPPGGERAQFSSTLGLIVSCMGCVVGTGNIWRFPRIVANNSDQEGGLVFLLVWVMFLFLWSSPLLLLEYGTGRYTKRAVVGSFRSMLGDGHLWCGAWISMVTFAISCFYSVVLGWCFYYFIYYIFNGLPEHEDESRETFKNFTEETYWPLLTHFIAILLAGLSVTKGVKTIEKVSMVLVPLLLATVLFTFVWSLTRKFTDVGIKFLFTPHWASFGDPRVWVDALSQNAFDTGAGMGIFIPYASYMTRKNGVVKYGHLIPAMNNLISLLCGITIFGTVFSTLIASRPTISQGNIIDILKDSGPASTGLTFIWMPVLFQTIGTFGRVPGVLFFLSLSFAGVTSLMTMPVLFQTIGTFGRVLGILFFLSLSFAGVTSLMSNFELATQTLQDFGLPRRYGMPITILLTFSVGMPSALDINFLTNQDFVWGFALVLSGMVLLYMAARYGVRKFRTIVVNEYSEDDWKLTIFWDIIVRVIAPLEAVALIVWWAVDLIRNENSKGEKWYEYGTETFIMTLTQWIGLLLVLVSINVIYVKFIRAGPSRYSGDGSTILPEADVEPLLQSSSWTNSEPGHNSSYTQVRDLDGSIKEIRV